MTFQEGAFGRRAVSIDADGSRSRCHVGDGIAEPFIGGLPGAYQTGIGMISNRTSRARPTEMPLTVACIAIGARRVCPLRS